MSPTGAPRSLIPWAVCLVCATAAAEDFCPILPTPKQYRVTGEAVALSPQAVLVIGTKATPPEKLAADVLARRLKHWFGLKLPTKPETKAGQGGQRIILGLRSSSGALEAACKKHALDLGPDSPGPDGYVIKVAGDDVIIGGCDGRGVIYGVGAFLDLVDRDKDRVVVPAATVRDWPTIRFRGCLPWKAFVKGDSLEAFDTVLAYRNNFIRIGGTGRFGLNAGQAPTTQEREDYRRTVQNAHDAGLIVYGCVSCGVAQSPADAVKTFTQLIDLGVDGLWISFDDPGSHMVEPVKTGGAIVSAVLDLGRKHGMTGWKVVSTPPNYQVIAGKRLSSYKTIDTPFNREMARIPGYEEAIWFFTRPPCREDLEQAKAIGLKTKPAWWHNWLSTPTSLGFSRQRYYPVPKLSETTADWGAAKADYEQLGQDEAHLCTDMVWNWSAGGPYAGAVFAAWAWNPEGHDWQLTRRCIYRRVFGAGMEETAARFDENLMRLLGMFEPSPCTNQENLPSWLVPGFPYRLKRPGSARDALQLVEAMEADLKALKESEPGRLRKATGSFIGGMETTCKVARGAAEVAASGHPFPGRVYKVAPEWLPNKPPEVYEQFKKALDGNRPHEAARLLEELKKEYSDRHFNLVREHLDGADMAYYIDGWRRVMENWGSEIKQRQSSASAAAERQAEEQDRAGYAEHVRRIHSAGAGKARPGHVVTFDDSWSHKTIYPNELKRQMPQITFSPVFVHEEFGTVNRKDFAAVLDKEIPEFMFVTLVPPHCGEFGLRNAPAVDKVMEELAAICAACEKRGTIPVLADLPPTARFDPKGTGLGDYNRKVRELGGKLKVPVARMYDTAITGNPERYVHGNLPEQLSVIATAWGRTLTQVRAALGDAPAPSSGGQ